MWVTQRPPHAFLERQIGWNCTLYYDNSPYKSVTGKLNEPQTYFKDTWRIFGGVLAFRPGMQVA